MVAGRSVLYVSDLYPDAATVVAGAVLRRRETGEAHPRPADCRGGANANLATASAAGGKLMSQRQRTRINGMGTSKHKRHAPQSPAPHGHAATEGPVPISHQPLG